MTRRLIGVTLNLILFTASGLACSYSTPTLCSQLTTSESVFVGRVASVNDSQVNFTVEERFKGVPANVSSVQAETDSPFCRGLIFEVGQRYVVFTRRHGEISLIPGPSLTNLAEDSGSVISFLRDWAAGKIAAPLRGIVIENELEDSATVDYHSKVHGLGRTKVRATGSNGIVREASTDEDGIFLMLGMPPGDYKISADLYGYESREPFYETKIPAGGCGEVTIGMWTASRIGGALLDLMGNPAPGLNVQLSKVRDDDLEWPREIETDDRGSFEFPRIPEGTYVLGVNIKGEPSSDTPYRARFYAGTDSPRTATRIQVDSTTRLDNLVFRLNEPLKTRSVLVSVVWWNGDPVTNAVVNFDSDQTTLDHLFRYSDRDGSIRCTLLTDREFRISVADLMWLDSYDPVLDSQEINVTPGESPIQVRIMVSQANDHRTTKRPSGH
jgi:hypothetical protein